MKKVFILLVFPAMSLLNSCSEKKVPNNSRTALLEVEGKFLYRDEVQQIMPPNVNKEDSAEIAQNYIRRWVTDVLMYENAKRNVTNQAEIDELVDSYRKSLTIHQYQQKMIAERLPKEPTEADMKAFYDEYSGQLLLKENVIKGLLLVVPVKAPKLGNVRAWVQSCNTKSLESIEKYSIQNAISYDYFGDKWLAFSEVLRKMPLQIEDPVNFVSKNRFYEVSDSTQHYFLRITSFRTTGQTEPFEMAREKIAGIIMNKQKADFVTKFEEELYNDAVKDENVTFFK